MKKFLKCLYICAAAFLCFSCSNLMNNGSATLVLEFPGASSERYVNTFNSGSDVEASTSDSFYVIKLNGAVDLEVTIPYETNLTYPIEGLTPGRYKLSVEIYKNDNNNQITTRTLLYYGEKDIAVFAGVNYKALDIYKLNIGNVTGISGLTLQKAYFYYDIESGYVDLNTDYEINFDSVDAYGAVATYRGGYKEVFDSNAASSLLWDLGSFSSGFTLTGWELYENGRCIATMGSNGSDTVPLYLNKSYYVIFRFSGVVPLRVDIKLYESA